jgi:hypothetical protein
LGKVLPILINGVKLTAFLKSNYIGFKEKSLVWSTVAGVNYINTTTLETNLTTEMTSSSAKKLNVSENTKKRLKKKKMFFEIIRI